MINWLSFLLVFVWALVGTAVVVSSYAMGIRLLTMSGRTPIAAPAEFTDAITVMTPAEIKSAEKRAAKAAKKSPLSDQQKQVAFVGACACFTVAALAVLVGLYLIVGDHIFAFFGG